MVKTLHPPGSHARHLKESLTPIIISHTLNHSPNSFSTFYQSPSLPNLCCLLILIHPYFQSGLALPNVFCTESRRIFKNTNLDCITVPNLSILFRMKNKIPSIDRRLSWSGYYCLYTFHPPSVFGLQPHPSCFRFTNQPSPILP